MSDECRLTTRDLEALELRLTRYDAPDSTRLIEEVQAEYVRRYGGPDTSPVDPNEFASPRGVFVVGYAAGLPVAMGGWRRNTSEVGAALGGKSAEIKRMYVTPTARGRGYARTVLNHLETLAVEAGLDWLVLETGSKQPEAIELYQSSGYRTVSPFGHYAEMALSVHLGKPLSDR